jgi:NADPH2:quinone reductase
MRAIVLGQKKYDLRECAEPSAEEGGLLIKVAYAGINRADLFQKQGRYPGPSAQPAIPGLEVSGTVERCGSGVTGWKTGDKVCALLSEGAFAEYATASSSLAFPILQPLSLEQAAALPEACFTAWISFVWQAQLKPGETVLIHGGASGIGHIAIQIARLLGARVFATAGSDEKCALCSKAGAELAIAYRQDDYVVAVREATKGKGVDVILDMVGGDYFGRNLECLAHGGRLCIIALLKGPQATASLAPVLLKHLSIMGSTLRPRPLSEKAKIAAQLRETVWQAVTEGIIKPVIDHVFPLEDAEKALARMEQGLNCGKILLRI